MRWEIAKNMRCDLLAFTGINFSGKRTTMQIYPSSKKGDLEGPGISSLVVIAPYDTRVVLLSSVSETDWEQMAWRAIEIKKGVAYIGRSPLPMVRVPDLENLDKVNVERTDPDFFQSYPHVDTLAEGAGKGWTYGRTGPLKGLVQAIRIEKVGG